jgi:5-methylcytosine-specific restriction endonuclease McrA
MKKEEAKNLGLKRFQLDAPCAKGHLAERYVSTGACTECMKIGFRQFYARNLEHFAAKAKRRRAEKPETYKTYDAAWAAANRDQKLLLNTNARAKKLGAKGVLIWEELSALLVSQNYLCANLYCRADLRTKPRHTDHKIPLSRGGDNLVENVQWLCAPCNTRKYTLALDVWLAREAKRKS